MGFTTINIPKIPKKTAIQLDKLTFSFNNHGERTIVIKGSINNIIVASARGSLEREAKKKGKSLRMVFTDWIEKRLKSVQYKKSVDDYRSRYNVYILQNYHSQCVAPVQ